jgi:hypothetical protein
MGVDSYSAVPTDGLVSMWSFSGDADDGWGDNDGALVGDAEIVGGELILDGSGDYVGMANTDGSLDLGTEDYSVSMWIRLLSSPGSQSGLYKVHGSLSYAIFELTSGGALQIEFNDGTTSSPGISSSALTVDDWYHVAVVYDRDDSAFFYINGGSVDSVGISGSSGVITASPYGITRTVIGRHGNTPDATIDNVMIFDRALREEEIGSIYEAQRK